MDKYFHLNKGWKFKVVSNKEVPKELLPELKIWRNANVPGTVHTDLLNEGIIHDPYYADNELNVKWVSKCDWIYSNKFDMPAELTVADNITLVFEGLDTSSEVYLNNKLILKTQNMFIKYEVDVSDYLKQKSNILKIIFNSPLKIAKNLEEKYNKLPVELESSRVFLRKAQYSFGWDWGPAFPTMGIWKSAYLKHKNTIEISNVVFRTVVLTATKAELECDFRINKIGKKSYTATIKLYDADELVKNVKAKVLANEVKVNFELDNPKLWWPNGHGKQNIYKLKIELNYRNRLTAIKQIKVGIRTVELIQRENKKNTFKFKINNKYIFINGVNWIPADSFLPRISKNKIKQLLLLTKDANVNLVRVWGGGIYESKEFYEICDSLGLLVWQDFMFACAVYPTQKWFLKSVKKEAVQNIYRLCNHPSLILWCGNNENEWIWYQKYSKNIKKMPDYKIYHDLLPGIINDINSSQVYWPSSPFGNENDPNSELSGNRHQWEIWSYWKDYTEVRKDKSLFVTEFGFQAPANISTLEKVIPKNSRKSQSRLFEFHNKQIEGPERLIKFLSAHLPVKMEWEEFIYLTQLNQGLALKTMIEHWRINSTTNGCIIWQLNDCWPVSSWSIVDYNLKPKLAYYFVKASFQNELLYFVKYTDRIVLKLNSNKLKPELKKIKVYSWDYKNNKGSNEIINYNNKKLKNNEVIVFNKKELKSRVIVVSLYDKNNEILSRVVYASEEWKFIKLPASNLRAHFIKNGNDKFVELISNAITLFIYLTHPNYDFSENGISLIPGEKYRIKLKSINNRQYDKSKLKLYYLNKFSV